MNTQYLTLTLIIFALLTAGLNMLLFSSNLLKKISGMFLFRAAAVILLINLSKIYRGADSPFTGEQNYPVFIVCMIIILSGIVTDFIILLNIYSSVSGERKKAEEIKGGGL